MRVLTTWMYFDVEDVAGYEPPRRFRSRRQEDAEPGIGVAWFGGDTETPLNIFNIKAFRPISDPAGEPLTEDRLRQLIDLFLQDVGDFEFGERRRSLKNPNVVDYVINQPVIIERSPPIGVTLKGLISSTNLPIWIGSYMGWSVAPGPLGSPVYYSAGGHHRCEFCDWTCSGSICRAEQIGEAAVFEEVRSK